MQFQVNAHRAALATGKPRIDWNNKLTVGLTACYVPSWCGKTIYDLVGGNNLTCGAATSYTITQEGRALNTTAIGANAVASPVLQPVNQASLFWRGILQTAPSATQYLFGVEFGDGSGSPFDAYDILFLGGGGGNMESDCNAGGGSFAAGWTAPPMNVPISAAMTLNTHADNPLLTFYGNGGRLSVTTAAASGAISYGTNPQVNIGGTTATPGANALTLVGYIWNRPLLASEVLALHDHPYQFLVFPEDDLFAALVGVAAVAARKSYPPFQRMVI